MHYFCSVLLKWYTITQVKGGHNIAKQNNNLKRTIMELIITAATIFTMYMNAAGTQNNHFCYNADIQDGKVTSMNIMDRDGETISEKLQYRFTYDEADRVASKEALKWDAATRQWEPYYLLDYDYANNACTIERREWNGRKGDYTLITERTTYQKIFDNVLAVTHYKQTAREGEFEMTGNMLVMSPQTNQMLASGIFEG